MCIKVVDQVREVMSNFRMRPIAALTVGCDDDGLHFREGRESELLEHIPPDISVAAPAPVEQHNQWDGFSLGVAVRDVDRVVLTGSFLEMDSCGGFGHRIIIHSLNDNGIISLTQKDILVPERIKNLWEK